MVSTGTETAQATLTGPGFDSQQVHDYDLCDIYKSLYSPCATTSLLLLRLEVLQPFQELLRAHPLSHSGHSGRPFSSDSTIIHNNRSINSPMVLPYAPPSPTMSPSKPRSVSFTTTTQSLTTPPHIGNHQGTNPHHNHHNGQITRVTVSSPPGESWQP
jgi:hypothetical protein